MGHKKKATRIAFFSNLIPFNSVHPMSLLMN